MTDRHKTKEKRLSDLTACLEDNPFLTDEELAKQFEVSISTIRLDRLALGIPEVRERVRLMAERQYPPIRSLSGGELVGELITLELGRQAISLMEITDQMVLDKTKSPGTPFVRPSQFTGGSGR
jgi:predicted DNA-binding transcriptional regulator YafY